MFYTKFCSKTIAYLQRQKQLLKIKVCQIFEREYCSFLDFNLWKVLIKIYSFLEGCSTTFLLLFCIFLKHHLFFLHKMHSKIFLLVTYYSFGLYKEPTYATDALTICVCRLLNNMTYQSFNSVLFFKLNKIKLSFALPSIFATRAESLVV